MCATEHTGVGSMPLAREDTYRWTPTLGSPHGNREQEDFASSEQRQGSEERAPCSLPWRPDEAGPHTRVPTQSDGEIGPVATAGTGSAVLLAEAGRRSSAKVLWRQQSSAPSKTDGR